jgi:phenylacetate-CoA ligase
MYSAKELQEEFKNKPESYWLARGEDMALKLFHDMSNRVPAYKYFLAENNINPADVVTIEDFKKLPTIDKDNYLRKYSRNDLCWDGEFSSKKWVISTTSGSTGEPYYFPRTDVQDEYYALTAELYLRENFDIENKTTLYIDAFAMGAWIGGLFTYEAIKRVAGKGYSLSIITPGINKQEVISSVKKLGADFDQVIIGCYPPILKDIIDLGIAEGLDWQNYNLGVVFSAEGFSEEFRDYIKEYGKLANIYTSTLNHYGTVDLGTMSHETPLSIAVRRDAVASEELYFDIFGQTNKQPTLTQFFPELFYFEEINGSIICSSNSGIPLLRYDLKDNGGVITLSEVEEVYKKHSKNLKDNLISKKIENTAWNLPFVFVHERNDFSVTYSGAQIYPQEVMRALLDDSIKEKVTGKFTMIASYDNEAKNYLEINVELKQGIESNGELTTEIMDVIVKGLLRENSEYRILYGEYKEKLNPIVILWPYEDPLHFSGKGKQKWVKK